MKKTLPIDQLIKYAYGKLSSEEMKSVESFLSMHPEQESILKKLLKEKNKFSDEEALQKFLLSEKEMLRSRLFFKKD